MSRCRIVSAPIRGHPCRLATAEKASVFRRIFKVQVGIKSYTLKAASLFNRVSRAFMLDEGEKQIGWIAPNGFFSRTFTADFPDDLPPEIQTFLIWLIIIDQRRDGFAFPIMNILKRRPAADATI